MPGEDELPNMDPALRTEIVRLNCSQLSTLFWQTYGWMRVHNYEEITKAVGSAMVDVRNEV